jgi:flagellar biosynthesis protein FlhA
LPAKWIPATARQRAELSGNTVVDAVTVLITHLGEVLRRHAHELLGREDMQKMLNKVRDTAPTIVDELKPEVVRPAVLRRVLTNLLAEKVPISSLELILESVVHHGVQNKDPDLLTERVREDIGNIVCERFRNEQGNITVIVIDPHLESQLREAMSEGRIVLPARILEKLVGQLRQQWEPLQMKDRDVAVLTDNSLRRPLRRLIERALPDLACIAYTEIPGSMMIDPVSIIRLATVYGPHELAASAAPQPPATDSIKDSSPAIKKDAA